MVEKPAVAWQRPFRTLALPKVWAVGSETEQSKRRRFGRLLPHAAQLSLDRQARLPGNRAIDASARLE
jgi:hypothetical protein